MQGALQHALQGALCRARCSEQRCGTWPTIGVSAEVKTLVGQSDRIVPAVKSSFTGKKSKKACKAHTRQCCVHGAEFSSHHVTPGSAAARTYGRMARVYGITLPSAGVSPSLPKTG